MTVAADALAPLPTARRALPPVEKRVFDYGAYTTHLGERIEHVRFGWESYGTLNAARDNAILIFHFFSGYSHAAGRYRDTDKRAGYWDSLIGPGKVIDTDRYFVLSADSLCNVNAFRPDVVTTGPSSIDPRSGERYGPSFPAITFHDLVDVQLGLLDSLGISTLHAAMGLSMGGCHCLELASSHPARVRRILPIACGASADAWLIAWIHVCLAQLRLDPNWQNGRYTDAAPPRAGLTAALKLVTMLGRHWTYTNGFGNEFEGAGAGAAGSGRAWADPARDPGHALDAQFLIEQDMEAGALARSQYMDANNFHYMLRALRAYRVGRRNKLRKSLSRIDAEVLLMHSADEDHMFSVASVNKLIAHLMDAAVKLQVIEHSQTLGHSDLVAIGAADTARTIREFLDRS